MCRVQSCFLSFKNVLLVIVAKAVMGMAVTHPLDCSSIAVGGRACGSRACLLFMWEEPVQGCSGGLEGGSASSELLVCFLASLVGLPFFVVWGGVLL